MKRFGRILLNGATALSLLLFTATIVFWVRSYSAPEQVSYSGHRRLTVASDGGTMCLLFETEYVAPYLSRDRHPSLYELLPGEHDTPVAERPYWDVDHTMLHKIYGNTPSGGSGGGRYSPPPCIGVKHVPICGNSDPPAHCDQLR